MVTHLGAVWCGLVVTLGGGWGEGEGGADGVHDACGKRSANWARKRGKAPTRGRSGSRDPSRREMRSPGRRAGRRACGGCWGQGGTGVGAGWDGGGWAGEGCGGLRRGESGAVVLVVLGCWCTPGQWTERTARPAAGCSRLPSCPTPHVCSGGSGSPPPKMRMSLAARTQRGPAGSSVPLGGGVRGAGGRPLSLAEDDFGAGDAGSAIHLNSGGGGGASGSGSGAIRFLVEPLPPLAAPPALAAPALAAPPLALAFSSGMASTTGGVSGPRATKLQQSRRAPPEPLTPPKQSMRKEPSTPSKLAEECQQRGAGGVPSMRGVDHVKLGRVSTCRSDRRRRPSEPAKRSSCSNAPSSPSDSSGVREAALW